MRSATEEFILSPTSPDRQDKHRSDNGDVHHHNSICSKFVDRFISMRCTDSFLGGASFVTAVVAILLQAISFVSDHWVVTIEPRDTNLVDETTGENRTELFSFNSGYWRVCWIHYLKPDRNISLIPQSELEYFATDDFFQRHCLTYLHTEKSADEFLTISRATGAIMNRVLLSAIVHMVSLSITTVGLAAAVVGRLKQDLRTFYSAILYIISGIFMCVAVMQYVCVVDDEMSSKMKKTPDGDESEYKFSYSNQTAWSFIAASISFICIEACALIELLLFLRRFPSLEDKMTIVPGLQDKVQRAVLNHEFDDIVPQRLGSRRNSPRISISCYTDTV